jgi:tRNA(Ile)-lysidine synthase
LIEAAAQSGMLHLLLGHHAADQAETLLMRQRAGSGQAGQAAIAALRELPQIRLLRPLLDIPPERLRATLAAHRMPWIEDPSNQDQSTTRARLRAELGGQAPPDLMAQIHQSARARTARETAIAQELAQRVRISPLGFAVLSPGQITPESLSALWQALSGRAYPPPSAPIARLAAALAPATLSGLRMLPAGRQGRGGWLLVRETPPPSIPAGHGATWDRFRLDAPMLPSGLTIAALGPPPAALRATTTLPHAVLRVLPALWREAELVAVPALAWGPLDARFRFTPAVPAAGAPWHQPLADLSPARDA